MPSWLLRHAGFVECATGWVGLVDQLVPRGARPALFVCLSRYSRDVGAVTCIDAGAEAIATQLATRYSSRLPADLPRYGPFYLCTDTSLLARRAGSAASAPDSNLVIVIPGASAEDNTRAARYVLQRVHAYVESQKELSKGVDRRLALVSGVAATLRSLPTDEVWLRDEELLATAGRALCRRRVAALGAVELLRESSPHEPPIWAITSVLGPALHIFGPQRCTDWEELVDAAGHLSSRLDDALHSGSRVSSAVLSSLPEDDASEVAFFGDMYAVIDDCGCKGSDKGGLARAADYLVDETHDLESVFVLGNMHAAPVSPRFGPDTSNIVSELLALLAGRRFENRMCVNLGPLDLLRPEDPKLSEDANRVLLDSCVTINVERRGTDAPVGRPRRLLLGGKPTWCVGVSGFHAFGVGWQERLAIEGKYDIRDAQEALRRFLDTLPSMSHLVVLTAGLDTDDLAQLLATLPPDLEACLFTSGAEDPCWLDGHRARRPTVAAIGERVVLASSLGSHGISVAAMRGARPIRLQERKLDHVPVAPQVLSIVVKDGHARYGTEIRRALQGVHPDARYVGSDRCSACHVSETRHWLSTAHSQAYATLVAKQRQRHASCIDCHVTGSQVGGFEMFTEQDINGLKGVGCEVCHGPGSRHVVDATHERMVQPSQELCAVCHNPEHSFLDPSNLSVYWTAISHAGTGVPK
ncbi:MAG TPA: multiheme c-type cytochrome [Gemmatimonadaceae bacterium]